MSAGSGLLAVIPARGGSKGLPGKNIRLLAGLPLIAHTIWFAKRCREVERCLVSTDAQGIAALAVQYGADVPFLRPDELARDDTPGRAPLLHAVRWLDEHEGYRPEYVVLLQPTSPLRALEDLERPIQLARQKRADAVVSVCPVTHHPYWMKAVAGDGRLTDFLPLSEAVAQRQELPPAYALNGAVYVVRREVLLKRDTWYTDHTYAYVMPPERSLDIDSSWEMHLAERILAHRAQQAAVRIAGRLVGSGQPCFVIAEAGVNHNGSLDLARRLVDVARDGGADAVKFQTFQPERLVTATAPKAAYQAQATGESESQLDMLRRLALSPAAHRELAHYCRQRGILFLSTPFDEASADQLETLGIPAFKISSGELTNLPLLAHVAGKGRPMIISTGMATWVDVERAVRTVLATGNRDLILLHCVSSYPADPADVNLRAMGNMAAVFGVPVGYSDHTCGLEVALGAVALGACVVEKHITLDRSLPGPDHRASLEPDELTALVRGIRDLEASLGHGRKEPAPSEADTAAVARKSVVAARSLPAGTVLTRADLAIKRPGTGISPSELEEIIGRRVRRPLTADEVLTWSDV